MLALFRSKRKSLNWVLWVMIVILGAGMLLLFVGPPPGLPGGGGAEIANVDGCSIGVVEFRRRYGQALETYRQQFGDNFERFEKQLRIGDQTINSLISECAISKEARRLGLGVSKEEVRDRVLELPVFKNPETGQFVGQSQYQRILEANNLTWEQFEEGVRRDILRNKLLMLLTDGLTPAPSEIRRQFASQNQEVKVQYVALDKETLAAPSVDDAELTAYFEENSAKFQIPEKRQVEYVRVPLDTSKVQLTEEQIQARMAELPDDQRIRASHILIRVKPDGDDTEARKKASEILAKIRAGADFAQMARQFSEDEGTAPKGGDLGVFGRGIMVPEFESVAFSMKAGEVSDLVKSPFGIHIIKVTSTPQIGDASRRLLAETNLRDEEAERLAKQRADSIVARVKAGESLSEVAQAESLEVRESEPFTLTEPLRSLGLQSDFNQQVFSLQTGQVTDPHQSGNVFVVAELKQISPARLPKLEAVRDEVLQDFLEVKKEDLIKKRAAEIYRAAVQTGSLEEAAKKEGLTVTTTDFFKSGATVDETLKFSPVLHDRAFTMDKGEVSPAITVAGKLIVFEVVDKTPIDEQVFEQRKSEIADQLKGQKRNSFFLSYVQNVIDNLRKEEKITIDQRLLDSLTG